MLIYKYDVPDKLIIQYCKIIIEIKQKFGIDSQSRGLEKMRKELHDKIFESAKCERSLHRHKDRLFNTALNKMVLDLTYRE